VLALDTEFWVQRKSVLGRLATLQLDALAAAEHLRDVPVDRLLGWLQRWTYDLLSEKSVGHVRYNPDFHRDLSRIAATLRATDIACCHGALVEQQCEVNHPLNSRLVIERLLLSYAALLRGEPVLDAHAG
jgi:DNA polymerase-3 subunit delta'